MKRQMGSFKRLALFLLPALSVIVGAGLLVALHFKYQSSQSVYRAHEIADFEIKRLTGTLNYRLNELREELLHLYNEQLSLVRALSEGERERFIFFRREHLSAFGVFVKRASGVWELQKHFTRLALRPELSDEFRSAPDGLDEAGLVIKRVSTDEYLVGFLHNDEGARPFLLAAVFRASYVFPFCRFFGDSLGQLSTAAFVLDDRGHVVCHSQPRFEAADFSTLALYGRIRESLSIGRTEYVSTLGVAVLASIKEVKNGGLVLVAEAAKVDPWQAPVPIKDLGIIAASVLLVSLACILFMQFGGSQKGSDDPALVQALLELQASQALVAGFQTALADLPQGQDINRFAVDYLAERMSEDHKHTGVVMCPFVVLDGQEAQLQCGPFANFNPTLEPFVIKTSLYAHPTDITNDTAVREQLGVNLKDQNLYLHPVYFREHLFALLVLTRVSKHQADAIPQVAQLIALALGRSHA